MPDHMIPPRFIRDAAGILADTDAGLSGYQIVEETSAYAEEYHVNLPHPTYPFHAPNKRTALYENLMKFSPEQQYRIIKELCDHRSRSPSLSADITQLKRRLWTRYRGLAPESSNSEINESLIEETRHWLGNHLKVLSLYNGALEKFQHGVFHRNLLDDLRLALEQLLKDIFGNDKSLENQFGAVGSHIGDKGGSRELSNMFVKLVEYYARYQNSYVKHNDAVIEEEIEFVFEITSSFMKHLLRLADRKEQAAP